MPKEISIFFDNRATNTYDIRYDKSLPAEPELPTYFINGKLPDSRAPIVLGLVKKGQHGHVIPAKLIILICKQFDSPTQLGFTTNKNKNYAHRGCFVRSNVDGNVTPHEAGHALELASKKVGAADYHDHGPWPKGFLADHRLKSWGLMYDYVDFETIPWVRREDWILANIEAAQFE